MYAALFLVLLIISFGMALRSMKDEHGVPKEIKKLLDARKHSGRIVFFQGKKTKHYSSSSSSTSSV